MNKFKIYTASINFYKVKYVNKAKSLPIPYKLAQECLISKVSCKKDPLFKTTKKIVLIKKKRKILKKKNQIT